MKHFLILLWLQIIRLAIAQNDGRIVCYYTNWSAYRPNEGRFLPSSIDPYLCTHLMYSFANVDLKNATVVPSDEWRDITNYGFRDFTSLKTQYSESLKTIIAVGGYRAASTFFSPISATYKNRVDFAQNSLDFLRKYNFDGLNIDWQFPTEIARNGTADDYQNFVALLKEMNKAYTEEAAATGRTKLSLTISVPGNILVIESGFDLPNIAKYVDFMNVLCYDYHFSYESSVYHHSPLYPLPDEMEGLEHENEGLNADSTINYIIGRGVQPEKLNLGIPLYGRTLTLEDENENALGSPANGQGEQGPLTREDGYVAYYEICEKLKNGWTVVRINETAMGPYAYKGTQWVGYDDEDMTRRKGEYAKQKGLGGLSFWAIDQDDYRVKCGTRAFPLIKAAREGFQTAKRNGTSSSPAPTLPQPRPTLQEPSLPEQPPSPSRPTLSVIPPEPTMRPVARPSSTWEPPPSAPTFSYPPTAARTMRPAAEDNSFSHPNHEPLSNGNDYAVVVDAATEAPPVEHTTAAPRGLVQNIYVWITTNIFHSAPPSAVDAAIHANIPNSSNSWSEPDDRLEYSVRRSSSQSKTTKRHTNYVHGKPVWS